VVGFFPVTVSLVVALEAFVGEKERGTIEPLLTSPLEDWQLYMGKLMAGTIVPLTVSYIDIGLYMFGLWQLEIAWPEPIFTIQTLALTAVQTVLMVSAAIVVSTQATTVRSANLLASFIVIPVALLIQGESAMMFLGGTENTNDNLLWLAVVGVAIISGLIIRLGLVHFKRENLLGREIDMLNLSWAGQVFWKAFSGSDTAPAFLRSLRRRSQEPTEGNQSENEILPLANALWLDLQGISVWYRVEIPRTLRKISISFLVTLAIGITAMLATYLYVDSHITPDKMDQAKALLSDNFSREGLTSQFLFLNNVRAELFISILGLCSFGVLGIVAYIGNFAFIGGILPLWKIIGVSPWMVFAVGVLPHGIFELPSLILISAVVLHAGLELVTPKDGRTIGEAFIISIADMLKIFLGVCVPLLLVAAIIEGWITPRIIAHFFGEALSLDK
jgi:uncharacterized membrane protein SpoIIM required for sporulation